MIQAFENPNMTEAGPGFPSEASATLNCLQFSTSRLLMFYAQHWRLLCLLLATAERNEQMELCIP